MSGFSLKILGLALMLIDHIGAVFFPQLSLLRIIGRSAFPIFSFLIAEGYVYTSGRLRYFMRLLIVALLSEIPFDLAFHGGVLYLPAQNVFFTLALGLGAVFLMERFRSSAPWLAFLCVAVLAAAAELCKVDYGWFGVILTVSFFLLRENRPLSFISFALLNAARSLPQRNLQLYAVFSVIPLMLYNGERGRSFFKSFFYLFYPLHLLTLWGIHFVI